MPQLSMASPVGDITVSEEDGRIVSVDWGWSRDQDETPVLLEARDQLEAYFDGTLERFDLPLDPAGSAFQHAVWREMLAIPLGETRTYGQLEAKVGGTARSVGSACGANPIPIIIPCHRVVAANGLGGFSADGGVATKTALLRLEGALPPTLFDSVAAG
ncbi:MAG: methylated-DNA--[protein]-cysteine S-methyltransferase [Alphaproteobacteria bacterium]